VRVEREEGEKKVKSVIVSWAEQLLLITSHLY